MSLEPTLANELESLLNRFSAENATNTPDFILAEYLTDCLNAFNAAVRSRAAWYGRIDMPSKGGQVPFPYPTDEDGCYTTPDGACISDGSCIHTPSAPQTEKKSTF